MALGGIGALLFSRSPGIAAAVGCGGLLTGCAAALYPVIERLAAFAPQTDQLAGFFQLPILILAAAGAVHSIGYLHGHGAGRGGIYWFFYNLTVAAMLAVTLCRGAVAFITAWEIMGVASFALVCFDFKSRSVNRAAWIYLAACHAGGALLIMMFIFPLNPTLIFVLAVLGFGLKIGFPALHVWLPEAHPAAPAPVSALMSGAMIQLGFYGILFWAIRTPECFPLYGWTFLLLGLAGAFLGVLFALPQNNLKKLLAYSSIENMGIIAIGMGFGFLGVAAGNSAMYLCGFGGAFLHMLNHALLKGGLFLGAGAVYRATGTLDMDRMGGLLRRAPAAGTFFTLNAIGLGGLPPFNGFLSEFMIYLAAFAGLTGERHLWLFVASLAALIVLALVGGLASAAFAKAVGAVFLGEPRTKSAARAVEPSMTMTVPVAVLFALGCGLLVLAPSLVHSHLPALCGMTVGPKTMLEFDDYLTALAGVGRFSLIAVAIFLVLLFIRFRLLPRGGEERRAGTWDCGFAEPTARMEYTATAFSQPLVDLFRHILHPFRRLIRPRGLFPAEASLSESVEDGGLRWLWNPLFGWIGKLAEKIHFFQSGYLHLYILIMALALIVMLVWGLLTPFGGSILNGGL